MKKLITFNYIDGLELTDEVIDLCSHSGDCEDDVRFCMELPEVKKELEQIDPEVLREELYDYGAWSDEELQDHNDNLMRILWIAAGNAQDGEFYEVE